MRTITAIRHGCNVGLGCAARLFFSIGCKHQLAEHSCRGHGGAFLQWDASICRTGVGSQSMKHLMAAFKVFDGMRIHH
jgi:hypothetical protein